MTINIPPKLPLRFFRWFCHPKLRDSIEGDLMELYDERVREKGKRKADLKFIIDVLLLFRPGIIRPTEGYKNLNNYGMVKSYFKIGWRNLLRNKGYSFINIGGLALGMACFLLIVHYVRFERSYESFHKNADNIVRVTLDLYKGSEFVVTDSETYGAFGPLAKEKLPDVVDYVRLMSSDDQKVKIGTRKFFDERNYFADQSVFSVFSFTALHGTFKNALSEPYQIVLTSSAAKKYFGRTDVVGEFVEIRLKPYKVTAVMQDVPVNTHLKFDFLLSHVSIPKFRKEYSDESWSSGNNEFTYLLMKSQTDLATFNEHLKKLSSDLKSKINDERFVAEPIKDIHLYSHKIFEPDINGNAKTVYFLLIIAIFIMVLAWVNYINLSTAKAMERAREVGIRKVMGSFRSQLVFQFLSEAVILNLLAVTLALLFIKIGLPLFRELSGQPLPLNLFGDVNFWYLLVGMFGVGIVLSGLYPALVLSSFEPAKVLKGKFQSSGHGQWLRKGLVVFQFAATATLIVCLTTIYLQIKHLRNFDLGINIEQTLVLKLNDAPDLDSAHLNSFHSLKTELLRNKSIQMVSRSSSVPGLGVGELSTTNSIFRFGKDKKEGSSYNYYHYSIDADYIPTLDMKIVAGRNFISDAKNVGEIIINEEAARTLGFASAEAALGEKISYQARTIIKSDYTTIIGVIKNFRQLSPKEKQIPMILRYDEYANFLSIRMKTENVQETIQFVKNNWDIAFPSSAFNYFFLDEKYNQQYKADHQFGQVIGTFSILAIIIACLGLFGLSSFTILQRTKEIGIRKVLGGSVTEIVKLLSQDFIKLVLIAGIIAIPFAYFAMQEWLANYAVRITISVWIVALPLLLIVFISLLTISVQTIKAALANPVDSLKSE